MIAAVVTGSFVMAAVGAFYLLCGRIDRVRRTFVRIGVIAGAIATVLLVFPPATSRARWSPCISRVTLAAMEGLFETEQARPSRLIGQPDTESGDSIIRSWFPSAELSDLSALGGRSQGPERISAGPVARQYPAALFQLSHHGRARNHLHRGHGAGALGSCGAAALYAARPLLWMLMLSLRSPISRPRPAG